MKKFILFSIVVFLGIGMVYAQKTAKLRLVIEGPMPTPGSNFFMALYLDEMVNPDYANGSWKTSQFGFTYDPAVLTPYDAAGPGIKYYSNLNAMFTETPGTISNNVAAPGDLRFVTVQSGEPGWEPNYYGPYPIKLWDLNFTYAAGGGTIGVTWQASKELIPIEIGVPGGDLSKIAAIVLDWVGAPYALELTPWPLPSTVNTWTDGTSDHMWETNGNWSAGHPPMGTEDVDIPYLTTKAGPVVIAGPAVVGGLLHVFPLAEINIVPGGSLTTNGLYQNDGLLVILSNATGAAGSFIDNGGLAGGGTYRYDRFLVSDDNIPPFPSPIPPNPEGWHFVASPVNNAFTADFTSYWVKEWNPLVNSFFDIDPWVFPCGYSNGATGLNIMQGYSVKRNIDYLYDVNNPAPCLTGIIPPLGDMISFGGNAYGAGVPAIGGGWIWAPATTTQTAFMPNVNTGGYAGNVNWLGVSQWNLLGNPYSASIDNAAFTAGFPIQVNPSIAYYDNSILNYVYWAAGVGSPFIPATQGFMVEVNTPGFAGVVIANNAMRTHAGAGTYYKSEINDLLTLQATGNGLSDVTYVRFLEEANASFDRSFDAHKLISDVEGVPQIYTTVSSEMLAINAMPATDAVPMTFVSKTSATYTIEAIETSEFATVILEDLATGIKTDLLAGSYSFEYTTGTNYGFVIHFAPLGTPELNANSINIWANDHKIYVQAPATTGDIVVYNMMGQEVVRTEIETGLNVIPMINANTYYIVKVIGSDVTETGKVFIK
jgi:hypothetical protein